MHDLISLFLGGGATVSNQFDLSGRRAWILSLYFGADPVDAAAEGF